MRHRHPWLRAKNLVNKHGGEGGGAASPHLTRDVVTRSPVTTATSLPLHMRWHTVTKKQTNTQTAFSVHTFTL